MTDQTVHPQGPGRAARFNLGWRIVAAAFMVTFTVYGVSIYAFIVLVQELATERHWSPTQTGSLVSAMWLAAPLSLLAGPLAYRVSPWRLITVGLVLLAATTAAVTLVEAVWQLYLLRFVMGVGKVLAIIGIPLLVSRWCTARFATAMAIVWAGGAAGGLVLAPAMEALIVGLGWQSGALTVAAGVLLCLGLILAISRGPRLPVASGPDAEGGIGASPEDAGRSTARRRLIDLVGQIPAPTATVMFLAIVGAGIASIAVLSMEPALLRSAGYSASESATLLGITAAGAVVGSLAIGWLLDRFNSIVSGFVVTGSIASGIAAFAMAPSHPVMWLGVLGAMACGFAAGSGEVLWINLTKRQFGDDAFPVTYGGWFLALQVGYAAGGSLAGWSFANLGASGFLAFVALVYALPAICSVAIRAGHIPPMRVAPSGG